MVCSLFLDSESSCDAEEGFPIVLEVIYDPPEERCPSEGQGSIQVGRGLVHIWKKMRRRDATCRAIALSGLKGKAQRGMSESSDPEKNLKDFACHKLQLNWN